jgi:hypothetical protein
MPIIAHVPKDRRNPASNYLSKFAENVTSQDGEYGIVQKILEIIGIRNKWVVEIGAWDGPTDRTNAHSNLMRGVGLR